jgi:hypothetical protein
VDGRAAEEGVDLVRLGARAEFGPYALEVGGEPGRVRGDRGRVEADEAGRLALLVDIGVGLTVGEREPGAARHLEIRVDLRAVNPQQQVRLVHAVALAAVRVGRGEVPVDGTDPGPGLLGGLGGAVGDGADEVGGAQQPAPGVLSEVGVLDDAADGARVQRLEVQGAHPRDPHHGVAVHLPGDRVRAEEPFIAITHGRHLPMTRLRRA